jgi:hypothetical protein
LQNSRQPEQDLLRFFQELLSLRSFALLFVVSACMDVQRGNETQAYVVIVAQHKESHLFVAP